MIRAEPLRSLGEPVHQPLPRATLRQVRARIPKSRPNDPIVDIRAIQFNYIFEVTYGAVSIQLPQSSDTGFHTETPIVIVAVALGLARGWRAGADEAHFAFEHVPELRQFVEMRTAHEAAAGNNSRIIIEFKDRSLHLVAPEQCRETLLRVNAHGAKLVKHESPAVLAEPRLSKQNRSGRMAPQPKRMQRVHEAAYHQSRERPGNVESSLRQQGKEILRNGFEGNEVKSVSGVFDQIITYFGRRQHYHHPEHQPASRTCRRQPFEPPHVRGYSDYLVDYITSQDLRPFIGPEIRRFCICGLTGDLRGNFDAPVGMRSEKAEIGFGLALIGNEQYSPSFVFAHAPGLQT